MVLDIGGSDARWAAVLPSIEAPPKETGTVLALRPEFDASYGYHAMGSATDATSWHLRGVVYDLVTLNPVVECEMTLFDRPSYSRFTFKTDSQGRYSVMVPALPHRGYKVMLFKTGYASSYLNPSAPARGMSASDRRTLAADLAKDSTGIYEVQARGHGTLRTDFYMAPISGMGSYQ